MLSKHEISANMELEWVKGKIIIIIDLTFINWLVQNIGHVNTNDEIFNIT